MEDAQPPVTTRMVDVAEAASLLLLLYCKATQREASCSRATKGRVAAKQGPYDKFPFNDPTESPVNSVSTPHAKRHPGAAKK